MKTIVLFHRLELNTLFVPVGRALDSAGGVRVVHLAYGSEELAQLRAAGITGPVTVFKDEIRRLYRPGPVDPGDLAELDAFFLKGSKGAFNLNAALQSDRGFPLLSLDEAQGLTLAYHRFWGEFLQRYGADAVLHEPCTLMFNFVAAMHCAARGGDYFYPIMAQGPGKGFNHLLMSGFDFTCPDLDRRLAEVAEGRRPVEPETAARFLTEFRQSFQVFLGGVFRRPPLVRLAGAAVLQALRGRSRRRHLDRVFDNIDYWQTLQKPALTRLKNLIGYRRVRFDTFAPGEAYYFYPLHLEPEAVVLYHAHGIYENQVKLIQNIAAQLPAGVRLYVKDHPHDQGYRACADYAALRRVPNLRLLPAGVSGKEVTAHSLGVITLTGSAGFEALLLGKRVFTFAKTFYTSGPDVVCLRHVRDLRDAIEAAAARPTVTDEALHAYLTGYFAALHPGLTDYFAGRQNRYGIDLEANAVQVAAGLREALQAQDPT